MASIDDYKIFVNSHPETEREYRTIEVYHPDFDSLVRLVRDYRDQDLTLEASAPRNPSESVTFTRSNISPIEPQESGEVEQALSVTVGGAGGLINNKIAQITPDGSLIPIELIYRKYYSGNLDEPVLVLTLTVSDINFKGYDKVTFNGEDTNFAVKRSGEIYTLERFPGLRRL